MGVIGFLVVFFGTLAALVIWGITVWVRTEKRDEATRRDHLAHADEVISDLFDGSPAVTYVSVDTQGGISTEALVSAANNHGYRLTNQSGHGLSRRVVFEKVQRLTDR